MSRTKVLKASIFLLFGFVFVSFSAAADEFKVLSSPENIELRGDEEVSLSEGADLEIKLDLDSLELMEDEVANISFINGVVDVKRAEERLWIEAKLGMPLYTGDLIRTGWNSEVELTSKERTRITLCGERKERVKHLIEEKASGFEGWTKSVWTGIKSITKGEKQLSSAEVAAGLRGVEADEMGGELELEWQGSQELSTED